jgi:hypothetical protein
MFHKRTGTYSVEAYLEKAYPELGIIGTERSLLNLSRLCRVGTKEERGPVPMSRFLAVCRVLLRKHKMAKDAKGIISYSDPDTRYNARGHNGGLYKASGFMHLGQTAPEMHVVDKNGIIRHRRVAYKFMKSRNAQAERKGLSIPFPTLAAAREHLGFKPLKTPPRDRWFLAL